MKILSRIQQFFETLFTTQKPIVTGSYEFKKRRLEKLIYERNSINTRASRNL